MCSVMAWAEAIEVSSLSQLQAAVPESGSVDIKLMADIVDASAPETGALLFVPAEVTVNLDMNGHKIHSTYPEAGSSAPTTITAQGVLNFSNSSSAVAEVISENDKAYVCYMGQSTITGNIDFGVIVNVMGEITMDDNFTGHVNQMDNIYGDITVKNGQYAFDPENYLPNNYGAVEDNGIWTVVEGLIVPRVRIVGGNEYASLQDAFAAVEGTATVQLLKDITLDYSDIELGENSLSDVDGIIKVLNGQDITLDLNSHNITMDGLHQSADQIAIINIFNGGKLTVTGDGTFTTIMNGSLVLSMDEPWQTAVFGIESEENCHLVLAGGTYPSNPEEEDLSGLLAENKSVETISWNSYKIVDSGSVVYVAQIGERKYSSLQAAINSAWLNDVIELLADVDEDIAITKIAKIQYGEYVATGITAGTGYSMLDNGVVLSFMPTSVYGLYDFLTKSGEASFTVEENTDISAIGSINVNGTKTLTINEGVSVLYRRQGELANIVVAEGAKLTIRGSGTFAPIPGESLLSIDGNRAIDVDGELVVGVKDDANNQPHFVTTSLYRGSAVMVNATGVATFNNADIQAAHMVINNFGTTTINGGEYVSSSTTQNGYSSVAYTYAVQNYNKMTINGGHIKGVQGALACQNQHSYDELNNDQFEDVSVATINGGSFETVYGHNASTDQDNTQDNYYALYVSNYAVVNIFGGEFKVQTPSAGGNRVVLVGDNDAYNTFGIINIYGGKYQQKVLVSKARKEHSSYPASIPVTSQWYSAFQEADADKAYAPLPAGYEYFATGNATYPWGVRRIEGTETAEVVVPTVEPGDPEPTIPWQQNTTWDPNADPTADGIVPEESTIVTIPVDATVVVKNDPNMDPNAVAEQVFVNQGATLTVETGTTLKIGEGGVNIANGGQIVVEPDAIVTVGEAGIVTTEDKAIIIEASEQEQGVLLLNPAVNENTRPKATVKLVTKAKQIAANDYIYERFAIPTIDGNATVYKVEDAASVVLYPGETELKHGLYEWDGSDWAFMSSFKQMEPFKGYQLTNNSANANVVYTFEGNLVGNHNEDYSFASAGFGFFGNSYTGAIDIKRFMDSFGDKMQKTIWIYDYYTDGFKTITPESYGTVKYGTRRNSHGTITEIRSMQAFLMNRSEAGSTTINYESAIWGNPKYGLVSDPGLAPKRVAANEDKVTIYVATDTQEDEVTFIRSNEYSSAFDNGADASKWMNNGMNLYVANDDENMAIVASDEIVDMTIAFRSGNESEYTLGFDNLRGETFELRDVLTGATIQMTEGATYTFSQEANTTVPARFQIIGAKKVPTGVENVSEGANVQQKVVKNGVLYILRDNKWYNAQGQMVK